MGDIPPDISEETETETGSDVCSGASTPVEIESNPYWRVHNEIMDMTTLGVEFSPGSMRALLLIGSFDTTSLSRHENMLWWFTHADTSWRAQNNLPPYNIPRNSDFRMPEGISHLTTPERLLRYMEAVEYRVGAD